MSDVAICFIILGAAVVLFVSNRLPVEVVALGVALSLWATGILTINEALSGLGDTTVVFIATLFVVSEALDATGVTAWAGQQVTRWASSERRVLVMIMVICALLTTMITPNGSVAAMAPMVVVLALRMKQPTSQYLIPLAFAAHAGSLLTLTGSPVNVLVSEATNDAGLGKIGFFTFALLGIPLLVGTVAIAVLLGGRLLPHRSGKSISTNLGQHAKVLGRHYRLEHADELVSKEEGLAEVVVPPRSEIIGEVVYPGMITDSGDLQIVAVQRKGEDLGPGEATLAAGDVLLVQGSWADLEYQIAVDPNVMAVDAPADIRRQAVPLGPGSTKALVILGAMVVLLATGLLPPVVAGLLAAIAMVLSGVLPLKAAYRSVSWTTVILVGGMIPLSHAMQSTGAAAKLADGLMTVVGDSSPYLLALGLFVLTAVLGQLISNTATALILIPVAITAARDLGASPKPMLLVVCVAAAASLLTPVATPANMMVKDPGGYEFGEYWKLGLPIMAWYAVVAIGIVPLIWRF